MISGDSVPRYEAVISARYISYRSYNIIFLTLIPALRVGTRASQMRCRLDLEKPKTVLWLTAITYVATLEIVRLQQPLVNFQPLRFEWIFSQWRSNFGPFAQYSETVPQCQFLTFTVWTALCFGERKQSDYRLEKLIKGVTGYSKNLTWYSRWAY